MEHSADYQRGWRALAGWLIRWYRLDLTPGRYGNVAALKEAIQLAIKRLEQRLEALEREDI